MAPRWKGKDAEARALEEPMSKIKSQLQSSLVQSNTIGFLCDNSVLIEVEAEQIGLLGRACFGQFRRQG
ncbi:hypothetical protein L6164_015865 [Bauhinia variegata]|uniref:Uncharacterized protein n=1 Tax=Bauhinia variegata TaxID=167791 RepID=A0ACB9NLV8_BAUVA|nr:hypothetical protein L6164_015865 [Bauhinia variegata]